jgi:hypothetical protein
MKKAHVDVSMWAFFIGHFCFIPFIHKKSTFSEWVTEWHTFVEFGVLTRACAREALA